MNHTFLNAKRILLVLIVTVFLFPQIASAATYYVATNGNDASSGTDASPWRTIQKAANTLVAGDTVYVEAGTYKEQVTVMNSGISGKPITFASYPEKAATIDGSTLSIYVDQNGFGDGLFQIFGKSYINVVGFNIKNSKSTGIFVREDYNTGAVPTFINIKNNYIENTYSSGVITRTGNNHIIDGNEIYLASNGGSSFRSQEIVSIQKVDTFEVMNNYIHNSGNPADGGEGIDAKWGVSNGKIHHNTVHDVVSVGIYVDSWDAYARNIDIYNNIVHHVNRRSGIGIAVGAENGGTTDTIRVYNNIVYGNDMSGFLSPTTNYPGTIKNVFVTNNVFYGNSIGTPTMTMGGIGIQVWTSGATLSGYTISNNIVQNNQGFEIAVGTSGVSNVNVDKNLIYPFRGFNKETRGTNYVESDALFVNPSGLDFHIHSSSPAINKGTSANAPSFDFDGKSRPQGAGYDIGAYEYGSTTTPPVCNPAWQCRQPLDGYEHDANICGSADRLNAVCNPPVPSSSNLIANPGFESGSSTPSSWNVYTNNANTPVWDNTVYHSGSRSVKISIPGTTNIIGGSAQSYPISSSPGKTYTFSAWGKTSSVGGTNPGVYLQEYDANWQWLRNTMLVFDQGTNDWKMLQSTITTGANTAYVIAEATIYGGYGTFWADDFQLAEGTSTTPPPTCTPSWQCRQPLDGYEHDANNCGSSDRLNSACNAPAPQSQSPYGGTARAIPGTIQVEDFDNGGEGVAYHDTDSANQGTWNSINNYRSSEGVDIEATSGGGYNIGWTFAGEWLEYSVNVASAGTYSIELPVASYGSGGTFHIEFNGVDKTGTMTVPDTGGWQSWATLTKSVSLSAGTQIIKIVMDTVGATGNMGNIDYVKISQGTTPPPTCTPSWRCESPLNGYEADGCNNRRLNSACNAPASTPSGNTYYVATNGNDANSGTDASPWRTITKAANTVPSGSTVYVKNGVYNERISPKNNGVTFTSQNVRGAVIDGTNIGGWGDWNGLIDINSKSDMTFSGFEVRNARTFGFMANGGSNIAIKNNYIHDISVSAIYFSGTAGVTVDENEITKAQAINSITFPPGQEIVSLLNVNGFEIKNNKFYGNYHYESMNLKEGTRNGKVYNNDILPVESAGIYIGAEVSTDPDQAYIELYNNRIHDGPSGVRGIAIASELGGAIRHVKVYNNIIYNNGATGISIDAYDGQTCWGPSGYATCWSGPEDDIQIMSNTVYNNDYTNGWGGGIHTTKATKATNVVVRNNIAWSNNGNQINLKSTDVSDHNLINDPKFVNAVSADFHLQSSSPAIDQGYTAGAPFNTDYESHTRPQGSAYDIGAYEYGSAPAPNPTCTPNWKCESPLNGYEYDGCNNRRANSACNAPATCTPSWRCESPLNGYETDGCNNRRLNSACNAPAPSNPSLAAATDNSLAWTTGGNANWFGETSTYYYGNDAAQSGKMGDSQTTWMQITVTGPGKVTFYWKVSSEPYYDYLKFYVDGLLKAKISGSVNWNLKSYTLTSGTHTLKWAYVKDKNTVKGSDAGWVDKVVYTPSASSTGYVLWKTP